MSAAPTPEGEGRNDRVAGGSFPTIAATDTTDTARVEEAGA